MNENTLAALLAASVAMLAGAPSANATTITTDTESLSVARNLMAGATVGTYSLFAGGNAGPTSTKVVDVYENGVFQGSHELSVARDNLTAVTIGDYVIFAGGFNSTSGYSDTVDIYNKAIGSPLESSAWSVGPSLSEARSGLSGVQVGDLAIFAGGTSATPSATVDIYNSSLGAPTDPGAWYVGTPLSEARSAMGAVVVDNTAIFAGGSGTGFSSTVDIYDADTDTWSVGPSLSQARSLEKGATVVGDVALFAGGFVGSNTHSATVDIFDASLGAATDAGAWSVGPTLSVARSGLLAATVGDVAIFAGGHTGCCSFTSQVDVYDSTLGSAGSAAAWFVGPALTESRHRGAVTTIGDTAMFAGGSRQQNTRSDVVDLYSIEGTVPEPASVALVVLGLLGATRVRRLRADGTTPTRARPFSLSP